jgi:hypothetical protein
MSDEAAGDDTKSGPAPALPDFYTDPNAVIGDETAVWRFGKRPDYAKTRLFYAECEWSCLVYPHMKCSRC